MRISIITPTLNRAEMLVSAIESVQNQNYPDVEHIIIDGGSTDGTAEVAKRYPHVRFVSGHDQGMYEALNKGLQLATGAVIGFLNSDDLYADGILRFIVEKFARETADAVIGKALVFADGGDGKRQVLSEFSPAVADMTRCTFVDSNYFNAWFFRKQVFEAIGGFDPGYRIIGDRELTIRFVAKGLPYVTVDQLAYEYRRHPDSYTFTGDLRSRRDTNDELIRMIQGYAIAKSLARPMMSMLWEKMSLITVEMAIRYLKVGDVSKALHYAVIGMRGDALWPARFLRAALQRTPSRALNSHVKPA